MLVLRSAKRRMNIVATIDYASSGAWLSNRRVAHARIKENSRYWSCSDQEKVLSGERRFPSVGAAPSEDHNIACRVTL
jgi:hypothetical protein